VSVTVGVVDGLALHGKLVRPRLGAWTAGRSSIREQLNKIPTTSIYTLLQGCCQPSAINNDTSSD